MATVNIKAAVDINTAQVKATMLAKLLSEMSPNEVSVQITVALMDRGEDWSNLDLQRIHKIIADLMWDRV